MNLTLRQMRGFVTVADFASFTQAAGALHVTQSALSLLVRELEHQLGVQLLDRTTRRVQLTEAGREFHAAARRILEEVGDAVVNVTTLRERRRGTLRIAAPQLMSCTLIPPILAAYRKRYADIDVRLADSLPERVLDLVRAGEAEVGIGPDTGSDDSLVRTPLVADRHLLVCTPDHPLARKRRITWADVARHPFIAPTRDFMHALSLALSRASESIALRPVHEVSFITSAISMAAAGLGVTACPSYGAPIVKALGLKMLPVARPEFVREISVFTRKGASLTPAATGFMDVARTVAGVLPSDPALGVHRARRPRH